MEHHLLVVAVVGSSVAVGVPWGVGGHRGEGGQRKVAGGPGEEGHWRVVVGAGEVGS